MDIIVLIGRILLGLIAVGSALGGHFAATTETAAYAESRTGMGNARNGVLVTGVWLLLAGVSIIVGIYPDVGALMFAAWLLGSAFVIHHFWTDAEPMTRQSEMTQFMKNVSIAGGCLLAFAYFVTVGESAPFQVTDNLINL